MNYDLSIPSKRIRYALEALEEFERQGGIVNMSVYYEYDEIEDKCYACLGEAAARMHWNIPFNKSDFIDGPYAKDSSLDKYLDLRISLDCARVGQIGSMFQIMELDSEIGIRFNRAITHFPTDRVQFFADMINLANDLQKEGY